MQDLIEVIRRKPTKGKGATKSDASSPEPEAVPRREVIEIDMDDSDDDLLPRIPKEDKGKGRAVSEDPVSMEIDPVEDKDEDDTPAIILRKNDFQSSTKLDALIQDLRMSD